MYCMSNGRAMCSHRGDEIFWKHTVDEPSRYWDTAHQLVETAQHLIDSLWRLLCVSTWSRKWFLKKGLWFIIWSLEFLLSVWIWLEKEKRSICHLSISYIKDGSANTNLQVSSACHCVLAEPQANCLSVWVCWIGNFVIYLRACN